MMTHQRQLPSELRPVAPHVKWWIVGLAALLLGAWELFFHTTYMSLPMATWHRINVLVGAVLVGATVLAAFVVIQNYEQRLAAAARALDEKNEALRSLEAERDTRLLDLSRDLALALADIIFTSEAARGLPRTCDPIAALQKVEERAGELQTVIRAMVQLRDRGDELTDRLPAILAEYQAYAEAQRLRRTAS
jgi:hypothetical protein